MELCTSTKRYRSGPEVTELQKELKCETIDYSETMKVNLLICLGGLRQAQARRSQRGSLASKSSRDGGNGGNFSSMHIKDPLIGDDTHFFIFRPPIERGPFQSKWQYQKYKSY